MSCIRVVVAGIGAAALLTSACKFRGSLSEGKGLASKRPSSVEGAKVWTVDCAQGWQNPDGTMRVNIGDAAYRETYMPGKDIDKVHCAVPAAGRDDGIGGLGMLSCAGEFPLAKQLTYIVDNSAAPDAESYCLGFVETFEQILRESPQLADFLIKSRTQPARIFVGPSGSEPKYQQAPHRVHLPWEYTPENWAKFNALFDEYIAVEITSDGSSARPACAHGGSCTYTSSGKETCARALCKASGYSRFEYLSASNDPCTTSKFSGSVYYIDLATAAITSADVGNDAAITARCRK